LSKLSEDLVLGRLYQADCDYCGSLGYMPILQYSRVFIW